MGESNASTMICNLFLAADMATVATGAKSNMVYALPGLTLHSLQGIVAILDELIGDSKLEDLRNVTTRVSKELGLALIAAQLSQNVFNSPVLPIINISIPLVDLVLYYGMEESPFDTEIIRLSKLVSIGCIVYASIKNNEVLGYFAAGSYLLAELADKDDKEDFWCVASAAGDYFATLIIFGSLFGYSRGQLT